jgi:hypothetical protein
VYRRGQYKSKMPTSFSLPLSHFLAKGDDAYIFRKLPTSIPEIQITQLKHALCTTLLRKETRSDKDGATVSRELLRRKSALYTALWSINERKCKCGQIRKIDGWNRVLAGLSICFQYEVNSKEKNYVFNTMFRVRINLHV